MNKLLAGESIAVVSDAGLPAVSDPGSDLVQSALEQDITVVPIPGANAALTGLVASGLSTERFAFIGFLPRDKKRMKEELQELQYQKETLIFYESPHRISQTLSRMLEVWGDRQAVLARELTKRFEEFTRGNLSNIVESLPEREIRGEFTVMVEGNPDDGDSTENESWWDTWTPVEHVDHYVDKGLSKKEAIKQAAADRRVPKRDIYNQYHQK